jgi:hypothetical protein
MRHLFIQVRGLASVSDYALGEVRRQSGPKKGLSQTLDSEMDDHCLLVWHTWSYYWIWVFVSRS